MESQLVASVQQSLGLYLYDNASFMCERLVAEYAGEANMYLLATCYFRSGQPYRAYQVLQGQQGPASRYLLALACMKLPGRIPEAEQALTPDHHSKSVPGGAAGLFLLGQIARLTSRQQEAAKYYSAALEMDPLLWQAFQELCQLGAESQAEKYLDSGAAPSNGALYASTAVDHTPAAYSAQQPDWQPQQRPRWQGPAATPESQPPPALQNGKGGFQFSQLPSQQQPVGRGLSFEGSTPAMHTPGSTWEPPLVSPAGLFTFGVPQMTPSPSQWGAQQLPSSDSQLFSHAIMGHPELREELGRDVASPPVSNFMTPSPTGVTQQPPPPQRGVGRAQPMRAAPAKSKADGAAQPYDGGVYGQRKHANRLFADSGASLRRSSRGVSSSANDSSSFFQTPAAGLPERPSMECIPVPFFPDPTGSMPVGVASEEGAVMVQQLLCALGRPFQHLCAFRCEAAIRAFSQLPPSQLETGWVQCQLGRAWYEMVDYVQAKAAFEKARKRDPQRLEGMEFYSTVLWHLKEEVALSFLAQEAIALDRHSPHAWAVLGNCFSLQKEHETAMRFFSRATQVDSSFTYAYTLAGHEYFANEDFQRSLQAYRTAVKLDPRHYNAWYGIGQISFRQEKWGEAEQHFRRALDINARSSVLHCYHGMALHKLERLDDALNRLQTAIDLDPKNPLAKFERAAVLMSLEHLEEALTELHALKDLAPREASVWFQLGKVYKRLGQPDPALTAFNTALDLKPSSADANLIKSAIERVGAPDDEDEEEI